MHITLQKENSTPRRKLHISHLCQSAACHKCTSLYKRPSSNKNRHISATVQTISTKFGVVTQFNLFNRSNG